MSDSTGTAPGDDPDAGLEPVDAVPAGSLGTSTLAPTRTRRGPITRIKSIGTFYRQVVAELRKVIWPTRKELLTYTSVVIVFVVIMVAIVSVFDFAFSQAVLAVFGRGE